MAYGGQMASVYGMGSQRKRRTPYTERINAAYGQATADVIARKKREQEQAAQEFEQGQTERQTGLLEAGQNLKQKEFDLNKQRFQLSKDRANQEAKEARIAMGMNIGKFGLNIGQRARGAGVTKGVSGMLNTGIGKLTGYTPGINLGALAGSGLAGYGAYQAMGGGGKGVAAGIGAGLLTDAISGGGITKSLFGAASNIPGLDFLGGF